MQMNEILGQAKPVVRLPEMDETPNARRPAPDTRAKRPEAAPRAVAGPHRNPRRYGAGF